MRRLAVDEAVVSYGATPALRGCSIALDAAELLVVLGPSGCGKSTLLRAIAGLVALDAGAIRIDDADVTGRPPAERDVAMVFQGYALFPHLDVAGNIGFGLRARKTPPDEAAAAIAEIAGLLGVADLLRRRPHELSGGERQRVALARALVREPAVALLDEPLASLDAPLRIAARGEIARLQRARGTTMVYVTHDQAEAMALGDRIAVMRDGRVVQAGTPAEIYEAPASAFVAGFVGNPPMNLVPDGDTMLGVRPEHVRLLAPAGAERAGTVESVERLGDHAIVRVESAGASVLAKVAPSTTLERGEATGLAFERVLRFDATTGARCG